MNIAARVAVALLLLAVAGFCVFGFLTTFEPLERSTQIVFRIFYSVAFLACLASIVWLARPKKKPL